ncbi:MAG: SpoIIE family protein phosphatase [Phycisphaerae bacterium]|nr:SpoIIE family protein phosphatase [Phycisphaerae bacterium]
MQKTDGATMLVGVDEPPLQQQIADLKVLLDVSHEIGSTLELDPLLGQIEQAALRVLGCERATVFLYDRPRGELYSTVATGTGEIRFPVTRGIAGEAARSGGIINVPDAYADARFNPDVDKATGFRTRNLLTFAMTGIDGQVVGVLQVLNKRGGPFGPTDESLAGTLSSLAGVALQRQMLLDEYAEKQKLQRDLAIARDIQQSLLPDADPQVPGYDIAGWNKPADETGGDCYDFIELPDGRLVVLIADATGHGIGPALVMAEVRALVRALASTTNDLGVVMRETNRILHHDLDAGRFVTTFCGVLDPAANRLDYVSGGHGPLLLYRHEDGSEHKLPATTVPLGILPEIDAAPAEPIHLAPKDVFLLVTDGFFEWTNEQDEQFGVERIFELLRKHDDLSAASLIHRMHDTVAAFGRRTGQADDLTAILIRRL